MLNYVSKKIIIIILGITVLTIGIVGVNNPEKRIDYSPYPMFDIYVEENFYNEYQTIQNRELLKAKYDLIIDSWYTYDEDYYYSNYYVMEDSIDSNTFSVLVIESRLGVMESATITDENSSEYQTILKTKDNAETYNVINKNFYYVIMAGGLLSLFGLLWQGNSLSNIRGSKSGTLLPKFLDMRWFARKK